MTLNSVMALYRVISPNSGSFQGQLLKVVEDTSIHSRNEM